MPVGTRTDNKAKIISVHQYIGLDTGSQNMPLFEYIWIFLFSGFSRRNIMKQIDVRILCSHENENGTFYIYKMHFYLLISTIAVISSSCELPISFFIYIDIL